GSAALAPRRAAFAVPTTLAARTAVAPLPRLALRSRLDHRQRHAVALLVDRQHPNPNDVVDRHDVIGAFDVAVGHLADVHQAAVFETNIDEGAEIHNVQDGALQLHAGLEVFELEDALLEDGRLQVIA